MLTIRSRHPMLFSLVLLLFNNSNRLTSTTDSTHHQPTSPPIYSVRKPHHSNRLRAPVSKHCQCSPASLTSTTPRKQRGWWMRQPLCNVTTRRGWDYRSNKRIRIRRRIRRRKRRVTITITISRGRRSCCCSSTLRCRRHCWAADTDVDKLKRTSDERWRLEIDFSMAPTTTTTA